MFDPALVRIEGNRLHRNAAQNKNPEGDNLLPTTIPCSGNVRFEAEFPTGWQDSSQLGLAFGMGKQGGYSFLLSVIDRRRERRVGDPTETRSIADVKRKNGTFFLHILRNDKPLHVQEVDAVRLADGPIRFHAQRESNLLSVQINDFAPMRFNDGFALSMPTEARFAIAWPDKAAMSRLAASRHILGVAPSPLENADALFDRGSYEESLAEFEEQAKITRASELRQESEYKSAMCLAQLERKVESAALFAKVAAEPGRRWPILAALQLWVSCVNENRFADADSILESLSTRYGPEDLALYTPADISSQIRRAYLLYQEASYFIIRPDANRIRKRERLLAVQALLSAPRDEINQSKLILFHVYLQEERLNLAAEKAEELLADPTVPRFARLDVLDSYAWLMIRNKSPETALAVINATLKDHAGPARKEYLQLLIPRSRLEVAMGQWDVAQRDLETFFKEVNFQQFARTQPSAIHEFCKASLIMGFIHEHNGDTKAAVKTWKAGFQVSRESRGLGDLYSAIIGSLSNDITNEDADRIVGRATAASFGNSTAMSYFRQRVVPTALVGSILRNMWRSPRGRQSARGIAFAELPNKQEFTVQVALTGAELMRRAIQGTAELTEELPAEEEKLIWDLCQNLFHDYQEGTVTETHVVQFFLTWTGSNNAFGWQGLALTLKPHLRGPLAYIFGHHYTHLGRPQDAEQFYRTALKDAERGSTLGRLAEDSLHELQRHGSPHKEK